ncbi:MAG: hypothetical protein J5828_06385, partial [Desulfovibrionaceae bacterium]|nr:hypothetical protein [Desulfovibrionaceae bacterium]
DPNTLRLIAAAVAALIGIIWFFSLPAETLKAIWMGFLMLGLIAGVLSGNILVVWFCALWLLKTSGAF